jgi:hypothetical protein
MRKLRSAVAKIRFELEAWRAARELALARADAEIRWLRQMREARG